MTCESVPEQPGPEVPFADRYTWRERALLTQQHEVECILAEALGYAHDDEHGWVIGDHTIVTLAMEARRRGLIPDRPVDVPDPGADLPIGDAAFIAVRAAYYSWVTAEPNTDVARAAYRAWTATIGVSRRLDRLEPTSNAAARAAAVRPHIEAGIIDLPPAEIGTET